jgi:hypothetical protein
MAVYEAQETQMFLQILASSWFTAPFSRHVRFWSMIIPALCPSQAFTTKHEKDENVTE